MRVLVTGATGLIGSHVVQALLRRGDSVVALSRRPHPASPGVDWRVLAREAQQPWQQAVSGCQAVVNLAGESVAGRWSAHRRNAVRASRIDLTRTLVAAIDRAGAARPSVLVSASASGFYGPHTPERSDETAPAGAGFLAEICQAWEQAALACERVGTRVVLLRIGMVLAHDGGALPRFVAPGGLFVSGPFGDGEQWVSWIHIDDLVGVVLASLTDAALRGPINVVAPAPVTQRELVTTLARVLGKSVGPRIPAALVRLGLGAMADEMLLASSHLRPTRLLTHGYRFAHPRLEEALASIMKSS
ncbi:MAG: TIGR01777 family protein [Deltaproteobacteria bacterium]|nr:TIGR01777 family protein [Deltaproteobacteria bacterium]